MSTIKSSSANLTLNADGANNDIIFQSNGSNIATLDQAGLLTATTFAGAGATTSITDGGNATAITIDSNEYVTQNKLPFIFWHGGDNFNNRTLGAGEIFFNTAHGSQVAIDHSGSTTLTAQASNGITYASGTGRFTVPVAGRYYISAYIKYAEATDQEVTCSIYTNANHGVCYKTVMMTHHATLQITGCANLAANDYIDFRNVTGSRTYYMADTHTGGQIFLIG